MRGFRQASAQAFTLGSIPISGYPFSTFMLFAQTAAGLGGGNFCAFSLSDTIGTSTDGHKFMVYGSISGTGFSARTIVGATDKEAKVAIAGMSSGIIYGVMGVWTSASLRECFVCRIGAIDTASQTTSLTPAFDTADIGRFYAGATATEYLTGQIGYFSIWDRAFTSTEFTDAFGSGQASQKNWNDPRAVFPANLKFMWQASKLASAASNDKDQWAGITLTNVGSPTNLDEPPMLRRSPFAMAA